MSAVVIALPGNAALARALADRLGTGVAAAEIRQFPDGEWYVRMEDEVAGRDVVLAATLAQPDRTLVPAWLAAATARDLGAARIGLVAPYLPYLRQDTRFRPGEGVTSRYVAGALSKAVDWLVTVEPHLHRYATLDAIYAIPSRVVSATPALAAWVTAHVPAPVLVGPDAESAQWVQALASAVGAPAVVLAKTRRGDRDVEISVPDLSSWPDRTPVLVDDIVSTARTMAQAARRLRDAGHVRVLGLGVHAVLAPGAPEELARAGLARLVTTNTIPGDTAAVDILPWVANAAAAFVVDAGEAVGAPRQA